MVFLLQLVCVLPGGDDRPKRSTGVDGSMTGCEPDMRSHAYSVGVSNAPQKIDATLGCQLAATLVGVN